MISFSRAALLASAGTLAAFALPAPALAQTADESWTGPYVGGRLGYAFQKKDSNETVLFDTDLNGTFDNNVTTGTGANAFSPGFCGGAAIDRTPDRGCGGDRDGTDWAAYAGFDYQIGAAVVGIVGEYGRTDISDSVSAFSTTPAFYTLTRELRDSASLRARAGIAMGDTLVYGTGGIAWGKVRSSFATSNTANVFTSSGQDDSWGYRAGGGIEQRIGRGFSIGAQYLYTSLKDDDFRVRAGGPAPAGNPFLRTNAQGTDFARSGERFNSHSAHVTASFRF